jgi:hypothetical protein
LISNFNPRRVAGGETPNVEQPGSEQRPELLPLAWDQATRTSVSALPKRIHAHIEQLEGNVMKVENGRPSLAQHQGRALWQAAISLFASGIVC